ncbi:saccharopine dehydrogenase NADP-binding domain-containing protein [Paenibacillus sp. GSMTC-2017]|uniref:saccharopine dehydrogenase NADP-binding domain-containing protein n=1 Tax=Paenibacillus sp. GSMTC-2017 TaxID=2794350 RepID=UPI0018DA284C|nr:saccharopine dehydrogenase NADP-binding domain-containing protein [Paenibacillus sp. GSMTC-2017]MBH5319041.1 saccharopine dehydrogenase NADP-binding domain-containing protein [Paenibacillus sp. GSMTC-2017]
MNKKTVLIVGGYGAVGKQIAQLLLERHPDLNIVLGGRSPEKAEPFASDRIQTGVVDNNAEDPLQYISGNVSLVINSVNDLHDRLLLSAVRRKIPFIDVTRWTELFQQSIAKLNATEIHAPVVLSSGWMAGTASLFASLFSDSLKNVSVNIHALYSLKDKAGPDSAAYMDRMTIPFYITEQKGRRLVFPMSEPAHVKFPNGYATRSYRLDTPDHVTLLKAGNIESASFRISFDSKASTSALVGLVRSGIWKMISGDRFRSFRRKLLYNPGTGSTHHVLIHLMGRDHEGSLIERRVGISDPLGQTHLTALGAAVQAEKILRTPEGEQLAPGIYYPEDLPDKQMNKHDIITFFKQYGVLISH